LTDATVNISITDRGLIAKKSPSMFSMFRKIEMITTMIEEIRQAMATGVALKM